MRRDLAQPSFYYQSQHFTATLKMIGKLWVIIYVKMIIVKNRESHWPFRHFILSRSGELSEILNCVLLIAVRHAQISLGMFSGKILEKYCSKSLYLKSKTNCTNRNHSLKTYIIILRMISIILIVSYCFWIWRNINIQMCHEI